MPSPFTIGASLVGELDLVGLVDEALAAAERDMPDERPVLDDLLEPFLAATPALFTAPPGLVGLEADVVRVPPGGGGLPIHAAAQIEDTRPRFAFRRDQVDSAPAGSTFVIAAGPDAGTWRVERDDRTIWDELLTVVVRRA